MSGSRTEITAQTLKLKAGEFDLESIHHLDLSDMGIQDLSIIGKCTGLMYLNLSHNRVKTLHPLGDLKLLDTLDLSCNTVSSLDGLEMLDGLTSLNLAGNMIMSAEKLTCLSKLQKLKKLRLNDCIHNYSNPVCQTTNKYKEAIHAILPQLTTLDGERIKGQGSEMFEICDELDASLKDCIDSCEQPVAYKSTPWVTGLHFKSNRPTNRCVEEAELGFNEVLSLCKTVKDEALKSVVDADNACWAKSL